MVYHPIPLGGYISLGGSHTSKPEGHGQFHSDRGKSNTNNPEGLGQSDSNCDLKSDSSDPIEDPSEKLVSLLLERAGLHSDEGSTVRVSENDKRFGKYFSFVCICVPT